jgi:hypothetical protein
MIIQERHEVERGELTRIRRKTKEERANVGETNTSLRKVWEGNVALKEINK